MESSDFRHPMLRPPPQHPSSSRSFPTTSVPNAALDRSPSPNPSQPRLPPRPPPYLRASDDDIICDMPTQETCRSQDLERRSPPKHPSHAQQSSESTIPASGSEHLSTRLMCPPEVKESSVPSFVVHAPLKSPDVSFVDRPGINFSMPEKALEEHRPSSSFESSYSYEKSLSEKELRDLYDDEEIDRFLRLFSTHVTEVTLQRNSEANIELHTDSEAIIEKQDATEDNEGASVKSVNRNLCLSEQIAFDYVLPLLPSRPPPRPPFSISRLRLTAQRLYMALEPCYRHFILKLIYLATWQDKTLSLKYCTGFWILWFENLLLPSLLLYLLYSLLRRKMHPYPSLDELQDYRDKVDRAKEVGEGLRTRMVSSSFGVKDAWRVFRSYNKTRKHSQTTAGKQCRGEEELQENKDLPQENMLDDPIETELERDLKAMGLEAMVEFTDGLERLKNIFLWRQPAYSNAFALLLATSFIMTLIMPTQYLAKLFFFVAGVTFWHVPPVVMVLPAQDQRRFMTFLHQSPTDSDYAMEVITRRVASGQPIKPLRRKRSSGTESSQEDSVDSMLIANQDDSPGKKTNGKLDKGVGIVKALASEGARMVGGQQFLQKAFTPNEAKGVTGITRTYPCQYGTTPGVVTLTSTTLFFTPLMSSHAKVTIPIDQITGIKKGGSKSISVQFEDSEGPKTERFLWVYERGDLFGRLVGLGGRKWLKV